MGVGILAFSGCFLDFLLLAFPPLLSNDPSFTCVAFISHSPVEFPSMFRTFLPPRLCILFGSHTFSLPCVLPEKPCLYYTAIYETSVWDWDGRGKVHGQVYVPKRSGFCIYNRTDTTTMMNERKSVSFNFSPISNLQIQPSPVVILGSPERRGGGIPSR